MGDEGGWSTIESDPGVFTALLSEIGVQGDVQLEELYSLDSECISKLGTVHGLIFLFKYRENEKAAASTRPGKLVSQPPDGLFFANQVIQNACATQAILSVVLNAPGVDVGPELKQFRDFSKGMDPMTTGMVISNSEVIRAAHNSFAAQQFLVVEESALATEKEDPFHFVAYIPYHGKVYELDGLQQGPREHGEFGCGKGDWLEVVTPIIAKRMEEYTGGEIRFNLMAVVEDARARIGLELETLRTAGAEDVARIGALEDELAHERGKRERWEAENIRRRHNFVPFIVSLLKVLAREGQVESVIDAATERKKQVLREALAQQASKKNPTE